MTAVLSGAKNIRPARKRGLPVSLVVREQVLPRRPHPGTPSYPHAQAQRRSRSGARHTEPPDSALSRERGPASPLVPTLLWPWPHSPREAAVARHGAVISLPWMQKCHVDSPPCAPCGSCFCRTPGGWYTASSSRVGSGAAAYPAHRRGVREPGCLVQPLQCGSSRDFPPVPGASSPTTGLALGGLWAQLQPSHWRVGTFLLGEAGDGEKGEPAFQVGKCNT